MHEKLQLDPRRGAGSRDADGADRGREIFLRSAQDDLEHRWSNVRNVTTLRDLMENIAELAG
jgi:hypothetical protein